MAKEVLERNSIVRDDFAEAVRILLDKGRGKYRNLYLKGPCNCAKTFLLNPLNTIYKTFSNPASTTFAWVGAEQSEVVFLNDFRWSAQIIPWHDFLRAHDCKYRESLARLKKSKILIICQKNPFGKLSSKKIFSTFKNL